MSADAPRRRILSRLSPRDYRLWLAGVLLLYCLIGFLVLPAMVKGQAIGWVENNLQRRLSIGTLRVNPLTFSATVRSLSLSESDGTPIIALDELFLNLELRSITRQAVVFQDIRLDGLNLNVAIDQTGSLNLARLVPPAADEPAAPAEQREGGKLPLVIENITFNGARIDFSDLSREKPFRTSIADLGFTLSKYKNLPGYPAYYRLKAATANGEQLAWEGTLDLFPFQSKGEIRITELQTGPLAEYLGETLPLQVQGGQLDLAFDYQAAEQPDQLLLKLNHAESRLKNIGLKPRSGDDEWLRLPLLTISDGSLDLQQRRAAVGGIRIDGIRLRATLDAAGQLDWLDLAPPASGDTQTDDSQPFDLQIHQLTLNNGQLDLHHLGFTPALHNRLHGLSLQIDNFSTAVDSELRLQLGSTVDDSGHLQVSGTVQPFTPQAELQLRLDQLPLVAYQPVLASLSQLELTQGTLDLDSRIQFQDSTDAPRLQITGNAAINGVDSRTLADTPFIGWNSVTAREIDLSLQPDRLGIGQLEVDKLKGELVIARDGTVNVIDAFHNGGPPTEDPAAAQPDSTPFPWEITEITIRDAGIDFADYNLPLDFATQVHSFNGKVLGLSSSGSPASVNAEGTIDQHGFASVKGTVNPMAATDNLDLAVIFKNIEMTRLTPYTHRFAGHAMKSGRLDLDLGYKLLDGKLEARNNIVLDKLELGDPMPHPDAADLPLRLAVALLKDPAGVINVDIPVRGDLNDPQFSIGGIVGRAIAGLILKTVAAPFTLLAKLIGAGDEELDRIDFAPGQAGLPPPARERLDKVADALGKRPGLKLKVIGRYDTTADGRAQQEVLFDQQFAERLKRLKGQADAAMRALESLFLEENTKETLQALQKANSKIPTDKSGKPTGKKPKLDSVAYGNALRERLIAAQPLDEVQLQQLAQQRATAILDHLTGQRGIAATRIETGETKALPETERQERWCSSALEIAIR